MHEQEDDVKYESMSFAFENMVVKQRDDGKCVCEGIVPIPIPKDFESPIVAAMKASTEGDNDDVQSVSYRKSWSGQAVTDRDGALWDNLQSIFQWVSKYQAKTEIYQALRMRGTCESPYRGLAAAMETYADYMTNY